MKSLLTSFVLAFTFSAQSAMATTLVLSHYPTKSETKKLLQSNVDHLILESYYNVGHVTSRVGYPGNQEQKNLNLLTQMSVDLYVDAGSYPSTNAAKRLNLLGSHVSLSMTLHQCLDSDKTEKRLGMVTKSAKVVIYCPTAESLDEATLRLEDITQKGKLSNLNIELRMVPSTFPTLYHPEEFGLE